MLKRHLIVAAAAFTSVPAWSADLPNGWLEIPLGGDTSCARGEAFAIFVNPAPDASLGKVVVDFVGGGACWDAETCAPETATFTDNLDTVRDYASAPSGIYARLNPSNPFRDYTHVVVPYCTGDVHWGAADVTYTKENGDSFEIKHRGAINAAAAVAWVKEHYEGSVDQLAITGCSAGAYGSAYWMPHLREAFPQALVRQIGDAGVGVLTQEFMDGSFPRWNVAAHAPSWISDLDPATHDYRTMQLGDFYRGIARYYPDVKFSQFTAAFDFVQTLFYVRMGGRAMDWSGKARASLDALDHELPNFRSFVSAGDLHCATVDDEFYGVVSDGVRFRDWFDAFLAPTEATPDSVRCTGTCEFR